MIRTRRIRPELLDQLDPLDPAGQRSRLDLRRLNRAIGSAPILARALRTLHKHGPQGPIIELGAGDGWLALNIARRLGPAWKGSTLLLVDKSPVRAPDVEEGFRALGWRMQRVEADAICWMEDCAPPSGIVLANLFFHHLEAQCLTRIFRAAFAGMQAVIALEPRRSRTAHTFSRWVGLLGCNAVTQNDAVLSVEAGFRHDELSRLWESKSGWLLQEQSAGLFSHLFTASRQA